MMIAAATAIASATATTNGFGGKSIQPKLDCQFKPAHDGHKTLKMAINWKLRKRS